MNAPLWFAGIDAGSSATKCVVLDRGGRLLGHSVVPSGFDYGEASEEAFRAALAEAATVEAAERQETPIAESAAAARIAALIATGYGRGRVRAPATARLSTLTEITCHARGARQWYPEIRHVIDIGGQDTKVIRLSDRGRMADYRMNAKCAAGTGTFLESIAVRLGVPLREIDELAMASTARLTLNSYCTVFTSTEVLERIKEGESKQDIAMGLFRAIASRVLEMMSAGGRDGTVAATGGVVTHCRAMVRALEEALGVTVHLPPLPQHAGAFGAALLASEGWGHDAPLPEEAPPAPLPVLSTGCARGKEERC